MSWNPVDWGKGAVKGTGSALSWAGKNAAQYSPARLLYDKDLTDRIGTSLGNVISATPILEPVVRRSATVLDPVARALYAQSGVRNYQEAGRRAREGDWDGALSVAGTGALRTVFNAATLKGGVGAIAGGAQASRAGTPILKGVAEGLKGTSILSSWANKLAQRFPAAAPTLNRLTNAAVPALGVYTGYDWLTEGRAPGQAQVAQASTNPRGPSMSGMTADRLERGPRGVSYKDAAGNTLTWNPRSGIYEVTSRAGAAGTRTGAGAGKGGKVGKGGKGGKGAAAATAAAAAGGTGDTAVSAEPTAAQLEALSPEEYEDLLSAARAAERGYQEAINRIGRDTSTEERSLYDYVRGVGREVSGERQDVSSALAQLGMDTSPASGAYADYLAASGQGRVAARRGQSAGLLQGLVEDRRQAEALRTQQLADLERQRINRQARASVGRAANFSQ
jgi:hypothetical protein